MRGAAPLVLLVLLVAAPGCAGDVPTSVLVTIEAESGVGEIDGISLDIFDDAGTAVSARRLGADAGASISLPATVVLYPPRPGTLRLRALASFQGTLRAEGAVQAAAKAGEQIEAKLTLSIGRLADRDGDGVPDAVDNCPDIANPEQKPCVGDARPELGDGDATSDADGSVDGPRDATHDGDGDATSDADTTVDTVTPDTTGDTTMDLPPCTCPLGCKPGTVTCKRLVPAGGFTASTFQSLSPITADGSIDTTNCSGLGISGTVQSRGGVSACVLAVTRFQLNPNRIVTVFGSRPLVLLVDGDVEIRGLLDLGAEGVTPGPGGFAGGVTPPGGPGMPGAGPGGGATCTCASGADDCGGGGASFGATGARGGAEGTACTSVSTPGATYGMANLDPLQGGSGGGGPGQVTAAGPGSSGGGGGGALQISAQGVITVEGAITTGGGGGLGQAAGASGGGGGGGGSGGAVLLEAERFAGSGVIAANGGGGGGGGGGSNCGASTAGGDGDASGGGVGGSATGACGAGGDGASGAQPAGQGADAATTNTAGGGGGGLGRVRVNWFNQPGGFPIAISAQSSTGAVTVN